jgi:hypothetical protein
MFVSPCELKLLLDFYARSANEEMCSVQPQLEPVTTVRQLPCATAADADEAVKTTMQSVSQRSLHKTLSRLHVDTCGRPNRTPIEFLPHDETCGLFV